MAIDLKMQGWFSGKDEETVGASLLPDPGPATTGRETLAGATIMEELRKATRGASQPSKLPLIGGMPIAQQFKVLAIALVAFFLLAALMAFVSGRLGAQNAASAGAATEMQMLSQRLARGGALTSIGNKEGFKQVQEARDRFRSNYDALAKGGAVRGVNVSPSSDAAVVEALGDIGQRWEKVEQNAGTLLANETNVSALSA